MAGRVVVSTLNDDTGVLQTQNGMTGIAKAWVNFNGTGTVAIRDSFNVSSITDRGTGRYTVNFTTAMPNANYAVVAGANKSDTSEDAFVSTATGTTTLLQTSSQAYISVAAGNSYPNDSVQVSVAVFSS